ncbi:hypothetical protein D3C87_1959590 [compost metagenome]
MPVQVLGDRCDTTSDTQRHRGAETQVVGIHVTAAGRQAWQSGEVAVTRRDQLHDQPGRFLRVIHNPAFDADQVRVQTGGNARIHLMQR